MKQPIDLMLDGVKWVPIQHEDSGGDSDALPVATHRGVLNIMGHELVCYQLSDGRRVFNAEDLEKFFGMRP